MNIYYTCPKGRNTLKKEVVPNANLVITLNVNFDGYSSKLDKNITDSYSNTNLKISNAYEELLNEIKAMGK